MLFYRIMDYYTFHSLVYTILYLLGYIPSTYHIVNFVFIVGTLIQILLHGGMTDGTPALKVLVFIIHVIPAILVKKPESEKNYKASVRLLLFSIIIYLFYISILRQVNIFNIYKNQYHYLFMY